MGKETDSIKAVQSDPTFQRRERIYDAARLLESGSSLPDDLRQLVAAILRQWLAIEFYGKRNLSGEYERYRKRSDDITMQAFNDLSLFEKAAAVSPKVGEAAWLSILARRDGVHKAETLVAFLMEAEKLSPERASKKAAEILGRNNPDSILRQYRRYKAKKLNTGKRAAKIR